MNTAIVVGAGPAGCVTALALAARGTEVVVLEAMAEPVDRFAGEWIHPEGVRALGEVGVDLSGLVHSHGSGFAVYPDDGSETPILLDYPAGQAKVCDHGLLAGHIRATAQAHPRISITSGVRVTAVWGQTLEYVDVSTQLRQQRSAALIVGADGRASMVGRGLGAKSPPKLTSNMLGLLLRTSELPFEGYGHVLLGGPGPVLLYRIAPQLVRVCLDIPASQARAMSISDYVLREYAPLFPAALRPALTSALADGSFRWAANRIVPRIRYGRDGLALAGDATGYFHPLSASGLSLAFADAQCLARSESVAAYRRERMARTHTTEMLATSLYGVLADTGPAGREIRKSIYDTWRRSPRQRQRTMSLLSTAEHRRWQLWLPFLSAIGHTARRNLGPVLWRHPAKSRATWHGSLLWLRWLVVSTFRRAQPIPVSLERQKEARDEGIHENQRV